MALIRFIKSLFVRHRIFYVIAIIGVLYLISNWFHFLFPITNLLCLGLAVIFFIDCLVLFRGSEPIKAQRLLPEKFSNSDLNELSVTIQNKYPFEITVTIIDEIPVQFQKRDFKKTFQIPAKSNQEYVYKLRPVERGEYVFCLLYTSPSPRDLSTSRMPSSA